MKKIAWITLLVLLAGGMWWGRETKDASKEAIKIGVIATLTGVGSYQGEEQMRGINLALEEINEAGGINGTPLSLIIEDSKTEPGAAVSAVTKLVSLDGVKVIIGDSWTATTVAIVPIINEHNVILISPLATLDALTADDFFFRTMSVTRDMMEPLAEYIYNRIGARHIGILKQETTFGVEHAADFREAFERLGGKVVIEEGFPVNATDLRSEITRVKAKKPDAVFNLHGSGPPIGLLVKQAKELGLQTKWFSTFGAGSGALLQQYANIIEDLVYPYPYDVSAEDKSVRDFAEKYEAIYSRTPDLASANAYDAMKLLADALKVSTDDTTKMKAFLLGVKDYKGASGVFSFDRNGDVKKPITIKTVKNGIFTKAE